MDDGRDDWNIRWEKRRKKKLKKHADTNGSYR